MTNKEFAYRDLIFNEACQLARVDPSTRQASKYKNKKGKAYKFKQQAEKVLKNDQYPTNSVSET